MFLGNSAQPNLEVKGLSPIHQQFTHLWDLLTNSVLTHPAFHIHSPWDNVPTEYVFGNIPGQTNADLEHNIFLGSRYVGIDPENPNRIIEEIRLAAPKLRHANGQPLFMGNALADLVCAVSRVHTDGSHHSYELIGASHTDNPQEMYNDIVQGLMGYIRA